MKKVIATVAAISFALLPLSVLAGSPPTWPTQTASSFDTAHALNTNVAYTVPSGSNQVLVVMGVASDDMSGNTFKWNTTESLTLVIYSCVSLVGTSVYYAYLAAPTQGTHNVAIHDPGVARVSGAVFTVNDASQASTIAAAACTTWTSSGNPSSRSASTTPASADTMQVDLYGSGSGNPVSHGAGQTGYVNFDDDTNFADLYGSWVTGSTTPSTTQGMSEMNTGGATDLQQIAFAPVGGGGGGGSARKPATGLVLFGDW